MNGPKLDNLLSAYGNLGTHIQALTRATNNQPQAAVDKLTVAVVDVDNKTVAVLLAPPIPGPTGKLDFSKFEAAVKAFEADGRHTQQDVDTMAKLVSENQ